MIFRHLGHFTVVGVVALALSGCGGESTNDDDELQVDDSTANTSQAVSSPAPSGAGATGGDDSDDPKSDCNDHDHEKHRHHRHHFFKVLDRIDGTKDHQITIASLPASLPARLIARLHEIDTNGDGVVTKDEVKAWEKERRAEHKGSKH
jgi:hypothetical protein